VHIRLGTEGVEQLKEHQRRKRHCPSVFDSAGPLDETAGQGGIEYQQSADCHDNADESDIGTHGTVDDTLAAGTGRTAHQIRICRVDAKRESGGAIR
jgi:hypothetical protein